MHTWQYSVCRNMTSKSCVEALQSFRGLATILAGADTSTEPPRLQRAAPRGRQKTRSPTVAKVAARVHHPEAATAHIA